MNELRQKVEHHINYVDQLRSQLAKVEEFQEALLSHEENDREHDVEIGIWDQNGRLYHVWLERDLGITSIQKELIKKLIAETYIRKEVIEMTLTQLIGGDTK